MILTVTLQQTYSGNTLAYMLQLYSYFATAKFSSSDDANTYISVLVNMCNQLTSFCKTVADITFLGLIIHGLPTLYVVATIFSQTLDPTTIKFTQVYVKLLGKYEHNK